MRLWELKGQSTQYTEFNDPREFEIGVLSRLSL